ncbi:MAG: hypothetical protein ACQESA_03770 [Patescibacteria group bacterium]
MVLKEFPDLSPERYELNQPFPVRVAEVPPFFLFRTINKMARIVISSNTTPTRMYISIILPSPFFRVLFFI